MTFSPFYLIKPKKSDSGIFNHFLYIPRQMRVILWVVLMAFWLCTDALAEAQTFKQNMKGPVTSLHQAEFLRDPSQQLDWQAIEQMPDARWQRFSGYLSEGFTKTAIWVRFKATRMDTDSPNEWFLELSQPLLADVRLYSVGPDGELSVQYGTTTSDVQQRDFIYRQPTFVLDQDDLGEYRYWIRIATPTSLNTSIHLYQASNLLKAHTQYDFIWGMMFGTYLFVVIFYMLFWFWTRENLHAFYTFYILVNFLAALFTSGWPLQYTDALSSHQYIKILGIWVALSVTAGTLMSSEFLKLHEKHPRFNKALMKIAYLLSATGLVGVMLNAYVLVIPVIQMSSIVLISSFYVIAIRFSLRGDKASRFYLVAFSFFYVGVIWRYFRNFGWVEPNFWNDNSYQLGAFAHMLMMSLTIFTGYNKLLKDKNQAEMQLRYETQMRLDQRTFVDMVSHEFRTPLSVVQATLANLQITHQQQPETITRLAKIERATQRMYHLIQEYLSTERMMMDAHSPTLSTHNLSGICRQAVEDLPESDIARITLNLPDTLNIICDRELIRIAVFNLLQNACKHSAAHLPVELCVKTTATHAMIEVADQGEGISPEDEPHIFRRRYRGTGNTSQGSGLGLYIVQSIATGHQGSVSVSPNKPHGSVFVLALKR